MQIKQGLNNKSGNNFYILCVDDDRFVLEILKEQLSRSLGHEFIIETAESAFEALDIVDEFITEGLVPGVVISDQIMPEMNGDEFLIKLSEKHPNTIRILLTGLAEKKHVNNVINKVGLYKFISKPWDVDDLNLAVKEAISVFVNNQGIENQRAKFNLYNGDLDFNKNNESNN